MLLIAPLASCRAMALANNKQLMISRQQVRKAGYQNSQAFAAYVVERVCAASP